MSFLLHRYLHNEISIYIASIYCVSCLQCSVNRNYNSFLQKWVGGSDTWAGWRVVCGRLSDKQRQMKCFHKVVQRHCSG